MEILIYLYLATVAITIALFATAIIYEKKVTVMDVLKVLLFTLIPFVNVCLSFGSALHSVKVKDKTLKAYLFEKWVQFLNYRLK